METSRFRYSSVIRVALVLLCVLSMGCLHSQTPQPPGATGKKMVCKGDQSDCGHLPHNIKVDVNTGTGVETGKEEICVCRNEAVTWDKNGNDHKPHKFQVEFKKKDGTPFSGDTFNDDNATGTVRQDAPYGKYNYKITVDGTPHDPRVVVGGGS